MIFKKELLIQSDGTAVDYVSDDRTPMRITASKHGVSIGQSPVLYENAQLQRVARAIGDAFKDYMSLKRTGKPYQEPLTDAEMKAAQAEVDEKFVIADAPAVPTVLDIRPPTDEL